VEEVLTEALFHNLASLRADALAKCAQPGIGLLLIPNEVTMMVDVPTVGVPTLDVVDPRTSIVEGRHHLESLWVVGGLTVVTDVVVQTIKGRDHRQSFLEIRDGFEPVGVGRSTIVTDVVHFLARAHPSQTFLEAVHERELLLVGRLSVVLDMVAEVIRDRHGCQTLDEIIHRLVAPPIGRFAIEADVTEQLLVPLINPSDGLAFVILANVDILTIGSVEAEFEWRGLLLLGRHWETPSCLC